MLAGDAYEPGALEALLTEAGFARGSEREFSGKSTTFDHVVARALLFGSAAGAEAYLGWLGKHADEILGTAKPERPLALGESGVLFSLVRCGTCKKELPTFLAAWRRDGTVRSLLAAGTGVNPTRFEALARALDSAGA